MHEEGRGEASSSEECELQAWMESAQRLTIPEMKAPCEANLMLVGGSKPELCTRHGGPGICRDRRYMKLSFEYDKNENIMSSPKEVACHHMRFLSGSRNGMFAYVKAFLSFSFTHPLVDQAPRDPTQFNVAFAARTVEPSTRTHVTTTTIAAPNYI